MNRLFIAFTVSLMFLVSCADHNSGAGKTEILAAMASQEKAWNNGDIDGFMQGYWKNDSLMFISGDHVSYGWQQVTDNYKAKYGSKELMGDLTFEIIRLEQLSSTAYVMIGSWKLDRHVGEENTVIQGKYSLIWRLVDGNWVIVIDHTS